MSAATASGEAGGEPGAGASTADASGDGRAWLTGLVGLALLLAAFPPVDLWVLGMLAPWPLALFAVQARSGARAFGRFCVVGVGIIAGGSWWLSETHVFNLAVVTVVEAPLVGLFGWAAWRVLRTGAVFPALPVLWTAHEMIRMSWPETGYGWVLLGQALAASPVLVQVADLGGVLAVTFVGASLAAAVWSFRSGRPGRLPAAGVVAFALLYGVVRPATLGEPAPGPLLATVQPGFPQELKESADAAPLRWERCTELARELAAAHPDTDLLVFPETMWPWALLLDGGPPGQDPGEGAAGASDAEDPEGPTRRRVVAEEDAAMAVRRTELVEAFRGAGAPAPGPSLLLGAPGFLLERLGQLRDTRTLRGVNTAVLHAPDGALLGRYDKHILIPGGETIPFRGTLPEAVRAWLDRMVRDLAGFLPDLSPGPGPRLLELPGPDGPLPFGVTICFENAYGGYTGEFVARGARFLVNLSNEGWFGTSPEFDHMELQSVLRAVETRRALFRSTNTGISCLVRPDGHRPTGADRLEVGGEDRGVAGAFAARVPLHDDGSLYVLWGDLPGWLCLAGGAWLLVRRRRSRVS